MERAQERAGPAHAARTPAGAGEGRPRQRPPQDDALVAEDGEGKRRRPRGEGGRGLGRAHPRLPLRASVELGVDGVLGSAEVIAQDVSLAGAVANDADARLPGRARDDRRGPGRVRHLDEAREVGVEGKHLEAQPLLGPLGAEAGEGSGEAAARRLPLEPGGRIAGRGAVSPRRRDRAQGHRRAPLGAHDDL
jgi:hypothetical protein